MRTLRVFTHAVQVHWLPTLILAIVLLLAPLTAAGATRAAGPAISAHAAPLIASVGGPDDFCGGAVAPC